jgi:hypothetical protein
MFLTQGPPFNVRSKPEGGLAVGTLTVERLTLGTLTVGTLNLGTLTVGTLNLGTLTVGTLNLGTVIGTETGPALAVSTPTNAGHRTIDATAQALHERNLASLAINLLDLPMDCPSKAVSLSMAPTQ